MDRLVDPFVEIFHAHAAWVGPILGLLTFLESLVLIGAFFPATVLMLAAGALVGSGLLPPVPVLLWCVAGAAAGDAVSYSIGRKVGPRAWRHRYLAAHRRSFARARLFFRKHGTLSIYLGRFLGPLRALIPLVAGMTSMRRGRFQVANLGSAVAWTPSMLAPGYLAAKGVRVLELGDHAGTVAAVVAAGGVLIVLASAARKRIRASASYAAELGGAQPLKADRLT